MRDTVRSWLFGIAGVCCAVPLFLLPTAGRTASQIKAADTLLQARFPVPDSTPELPVTTRDPFVSDDAPIQRVSTSVRSGAVIVRAIVGGADARALIEDAGRMRVVQAGDAVEADTILSIKPDEVVFRSGKIVRIELVR